MTDGENLFTLSRIETSTSQQTAMLPADMKSSLVGRYQLADSAGSFRWGGTAHVNASGRLQLVAAPRDYKLIGTSDFGVWTSSIGEPSGPRFRFTIDRIHCTETDEGGEDEIYLVFSNGERYPHSGAHSINEDDHRMENWYVNYSVVFAGGNMRMTLMEHDTTSADDNLGSITVGPWAASGSQPITGGDGRYEVYWRVVEE